MRTNIIALFLWMLIAVGVRATGGTTESMLLTVAIGFLATIMYIMFDIYEELKRGNKS